MLQSVLEIKTEWFLKKTTRHFSLATRWRPHHTSCSLEPTPLYTCPGGGNSIPLVFLPGKFQGQRSLERYRPRGHNESTGHDCEGLSTVHLRGSRREGQGASYMRVQTVLASLTPWKGSPSHTLRTAALLNLFMSQGATVPQSGLPAIIQRRSYRIKTTLVSFKAKTGKFLR